MPLLLITGARLIRFAVVLSLLFAQPVVIGERHEELRVDVLIEYKYNRLSINANERKLEYNVIIDKHLQHDVNVYLYLLRLTNFYEPPQWIGGYTTVKMKGESEKVGRWDLRDPNITVKKGAFHVLAATTDITNLQETFPEVHSEMFYIKW